MRCVDGVVESSLGARKWYPNATRLQLCASLFVLYICLRLTQAIGKETDTAMGISILVMNAVPRYVEFSWYFWTNDGLRTAVANLQPGIRI